MTDISELFARDPLQLSKQDIGQIVARFRESRKAFNLGNVRAGSTKAPTPKQRATSDLLAKIDSAGIKISL